MMANVNTGAFNTYENQQKAIERRRQMAQALQQQSMAEVPQTYPGASFQPTQGLAKLAQAFVAKRNMDKADEQERALGEKYQSDYRQLLSTALAKMKTDPEGALGDLAAHPQGAALVPLAMQEIQRRNLMQALRGQGGLVSSQPSPGPWAQGQDMGPPGMGGTGGQPPQDAMSLGGPARGIPLEAWLAVDPTGGKYLGALSEGNETLGGVQYDQNGRAFTINKSGQPNFLPGITARDKPEMINTGNAIVPVNPYQQNQPIPMGISPNDQIGNAQRAVGLQIQQQAADRELAKMRDEGIAVPPSRPLPIPGMQPPTPVPQAAQMPQDTSIPQVPQGPMAPQQPGFPRQPTPPIIKNQTAPRPQMPSAPQPQGAALPIPARTNTAMSPKQQRELAAKREEERPKATLSVQQARAQSRNVMSKVDDALKLTGRFTSGASGSVGSIIPGTQAYDLSKTLDTIKANLGFKELAAMRAASPTGGALGSVTERELSLLESAVNSLDQGQSREQLVKNLNAVKTHYENYLKAVEQDYEGKYGKLADPNAPPSPSGWDADKERRYQEWLKRQQ